MASALGEEGLIAGIDMAWGTTSVATRKAAGGLNHSTQFAVMDSRRLAFASGSFDAVLPCLGIQAVGHDATFREAFRVVTSGGRLVFCDWSKDGVRSPNVARLLEKYRPAKPSSEVSRLLEARHTINRTGEPAAMTSPEVVTGKLRRVGFHEVAVTTRTERIVYPSVDAYLRRQLAWGDNEREFRLMSREDLDAFVEDLEREAQPFLKPEGLVTLARINYFLAHK